MGREDEREGRRESRVRETGSYNMAIRIGVCERRESWLVALSSSFIASALKQAQSVACLTDWKKSGSTRLPTRLAAELNGKWPGRARPHTGPRLPKPGLTAPTSRIPDRQVYFIHQWVLRLQQKSDNNLHHCVACVGSVCIGSNPFFGPPCLLNTDIKLNRLIIPHWSPCKGRCVSVAAVVVALHLPRLSVPQAKIKHRA